MRGLAAQILERETAELPDAPDPADATTRVCARLHPQFAQLVGSAGCDLLLARAISVAISECPRLHGVRWQPGSAGGLENLRERLEGCPPGEARQACATLVAEFLALLCKFIGAEMTVRQVQRLWPELPARETGPELRREHRPEDAE